MTSVVEIDIAAPRARVADLFFDPANNPKWMSDIERCEPVNGTLGMPGSTYRLVPKSGNRVFVATVLSKDLPDELRRSNSSWSMNFYAKGDPVRRAGMRSIGAVGMIVCIAAVPAFVSARCA